MGKVNVGGDFGEVVAPRYVGTATFGNSQAVDPTGTTIVPANSGRRRGVVVRCTHASVALIVGSTLSDCNFTISAASAGGNNQVEVFGQGAVYVRGLTNTSSVAWIEY